MNLLIEQRQKNQAETEKALDAERQRAAGLARQVDNLKDLIAKLERRPRQRRPRGARGRRARPTTPSRRQADLATLKDPGRLAPAVAFASTRGRLPLPVNGVKIREFGARTASAAPKRGCPSRPGRPPRSPPRATAGLFTPDRSAPTANS